MRFEQAPITSDLSLQLLDARQIGDVLGSEELFVLVQNRVSSDGLVLFGTEDGADRWPIALRATVSVEQSNVTIHLADVLVAELAELEVDEQVAFEDDVVEYEVDVEVVVLEREPFLPRDERETAAELREEVRQLG